MYKFLLSVVMVGALCVIPTLVHADEDALKVDAFAEALKGQDPAAYETFVKLRAERDKHIEELKRIQGEIKKASSEEKIRLYQQFRIARKKYAASYLAFIDFLDDRDKQVIVRYEAAIARVKAVMERRQKARDELQKAMKEE